MSYLYVKGHKPKAKATVVKPKPVEKAERKAVKAD
jgi:hypothetical protein